MSEPYDSIMEGLQQCLAYEQGDKTQAREETAFCDKCGEYQPYSISAADETITIKGTTFSCVKMQAFCAACGSSIYVPWINDANVNAREEGYHKAKEGDMNE